MKALSVTGFEATDIRSQVEKVMRGLGNPEPPLNLDDVRQLLRLDRQFYSGSDVSTLREIVSRIKVAGRQILERPMILFEAIRKADLSALYLPDKRRILIDQDKPQLKHRWNEAHEVGHSLIPWHAEMNLGDTDFTLRPECHAIIEAEANYAAGQLLFLQDKFVRDSRDVRRSIDSVRELATRYKNTVTSTLWRFAESMPNDVAVLAIVSQHPKRLKEPFDINNPCKYFIPSSRFRREFSGVTEAQAFSQISSYCGYQRGGSLGSVEAILHDDRRAPHVFCFESFSNTYEVLTIASHLRPYPLSVSMSV